MRDLVVTAFVTLDGVMEDPQNWSFPYWSDEVQEFKREELWSSGPQLLGRVTYEGFAAAWPERTGDFADRLNTAEKIVVSKTLQSPSWKPVRVIREVDRLEAEIGRLKNESGPKILVHGSLQLSQALLRLGLVDELRLVVFPLVLGAGRRLFAEGDALKFEVVKSQTSSKGVTMQSLRPVRDGEGE